ncbi:MAG: hypothetical protein AB2L22_08430 [Syntrophales bacterium]
MRECVIIRLDIGRLVWLAGGFPEQTVPCTLTRMCHSGVATLCGGLGNANAILLERVEK